MTENRPGASSESGRVPRIGAAGDLRAEIAAARRHPGRVVGKLTILNEIGRGGMGVVYRAWQEDLQRVVAVKMLAPEANATMKQRFLREARLASRLRHPHIVAVHELGEQGQRAWFTMDLIEGTGLDVLIRKKRLTTMQFMRIVADVAKALDYAHAHGVVHRDIKPSNVLVSEALEAWLMDFGLAVEQAGVSRLTMAGTVMGTPFYMSPEQARGDSSAVNGRSDVCSLGAVMYEGLTGHTPFARPDVIATMKAIVDEEPEPPSRKTPGVPRDLEVICLKCLEKDPSRRYPTAGALADDIERWIAGQTIEAKAAGLGSRAAKAVRRRLLWLAAGAAALAVAGVVGWFVVQQNRMKAELAALREELARETDPEKRRALEAAIAAKLDGRQAPERPPPEKPPVKPPDVPPVKPPPDEVPKGVEKDEAAWTALLARVGPLRGRRMLGDALREVIAWTPETPQFRTRAEMLANEIREDARVAWERADASAARLEADGKLEEAAREYEAVVALGVEEYALLAAAALRRVRDALNRAGRQTALPLLEPLLARLVELGAGLKFPEAAREIERVRAQAPSLAPELDAWAGLVRDAQEALGCAPTGAASLKGEELDVPAGRGTLEDATPDRVKFALEGGATMELRYAELPPSLLLRMAEAGGAAPEGIGLLRLFSESAAAARRAWAASPRRAELEAFADRIAAAGAEREAGDALAALLEAAKRRDWKKCRDLLSRRDKHAGSRAWKDAATQLDEIAFQAAEIAEGEPFAVPAKRWGSGLFLEYDFAAPAQLRDWRLDCRGFHGTAGRAGLRLEDGSLRLRDAELAWIAPIRGDVEVRADLTVLEGSPAELWLCAGGYRLALRPRSARLDFSCFSQSPGAPIEVPEIGKTFRLSLRIAGGEATASLDGRPFIAAPAEDPIFTSPPYLSAERGTTVRVDNFAVSGAPPKGWSDEWRARAALLARVGRGLPLDKPQVLTDGSSLGRFNSPDSGAWSVADKALRGTSPGERPIAELNNGDRWRNFRLRFKYEIHEGRSAAVQVRNGSATLQFMLPADLPGKRREVEIVAVESQVSAVVDGLVALAPFGFPDDPTPGGVRFFVQGASASLRDVVLEEIRNAPAEEDWKELLSGLLATGFRLRGFAIEDRVATGMAPVSLESEGPLGDGVLRIVFTSSEPTPLRIAMRGETVFDRVVPNGNQLLVLRVRGDVLEGRLGRLVLIEERKLKKGPGPVAIEWGKGRIQLRTIKTRTGR